MLVKAKIKPNSKKFKIVDKKGFFEVHVTKPLENNQANLEIIKEFSKKYGKCRIIRGKTTRNKVLSFER